MIRFTKSMLVGLWMTTFCQGLFCQSDSIQTRNYIGIGILGNNYLPPFHDFGMEGYFLSSFSVNYSNQLLWKKSCVQISAGLGAFVAEWYDTDGDQWVQPYVEHHTWGVTLPVGVLYRINYKPNGFWIGISHASAFGTQQYTYNPTRSSMVVKTIKYDGQIMPNLVYQLSPGAHNVIIAFFYSPKFIARRSEVSRYFNWEVLPLYGGIMISTKLSGHVE